VTQPDPIPPGQDTDSGTEQVNPDPFPDADVFGLTKDVNQLQLNDELNAKLGATVLVAVSPVDSNRVISDDNPAKLYISPSGQDQSKVYDTINAHVPYAAYDVPAADRQYSEVVQKTVEDFTAELTLDEMQTAIKGLLLKQNTAEQSALTQEVPGPLAP
jgi:hypothetical protein